MTSEPQLSFPPFHLDLANEQLWRGAELLPLRPKAFRLLRYLAEHPQRLVTQEELLKAIWEHSYFNDALLRGYIRELRGLLGDDAKTPRCRSQAPPPQTPPGARRAAPAPGPCAVDGRLSL